MLRRAPQGLIRLLYGTGRNDLCTQKYRQWVKTPFVVDSIVLYLPHANTHSELKVIRRKRTTGKYTLGLTAPM